MVTLRMYFLTSMNKGAVIVVWLCFPFRRQTLGRITARRNSVGLSKHIFLTEELIRNWHEKWKIYVKNNHLGKGANMQGWWSKSISGIVCRFLVFLAMFSASILLLFYFESGLHWSFLLPV